MRKRPFDTTWDVMARRKGKKIAFLSGLGVLTGLVVVAGVHWQSVMVHYHLYRLRSEPEYLRAIIGEPTGTPATTAVVRFLETRQGQESWYSLRFEQSKQRDKKQIVAEVRRLGRVSMIPFLVQRMGALVAFVGDDEPRTLFPVAEAFDLVAFVGDDDPQILFAAAEALVEEHLETAVPHLLRILHKGTPQERSLAVEILPATTEKAKLVVPVFIKALEIHDGDVRCHAVRALGSVLHKNPKSSFEAVPSTVELTAVEALTKALSDDNHRVVSEALFSLGRIGVPTEQAVKRIRALVSHKEPSVRFDADYALELILGEDNVANPTSSEAIKRRWRSREKAKNQEE